MAFIGIADGKSLTDIAEALVRCAELHSGEEKSVLLESAYMVLTRRCAQIDAEIVAVQPKGGDA